MTERSNTPDSPPSTANQTNKRKLPSSSDDADLLPKPADTFSRSLTCSGCQTIVSKAIKIDIASGLCRNCLEKTRIAAKRQASKFGNLTGSGFDERVGCAAAMGFNHTDSHEAQHMFYTMKSMNFQPFRMKTYTKAQKSLGQVAGWISSATAARVTKSFDFVNSTQSSSLECMIELAEPSNNATSEKSNIAASMAVAMHNSCVPWLLGCLGPYDELPDDIAHDLHMDFRLYPSFLPAIASLLAGSIIHGDKTLLTITNEVYSRSIQVDRHAESSGNSLPSPDVDVFCGIISDADGYGTKNKLVIGTNTINILITCSAVVDAKLKVFVGPNVDLLTSDLDSRGKRSQLYLRRSCVEQFRKFKMTIDPASITPTPNLTKLRQLVSAFDHRSTYAMLRETLPGFANEQHCPVTVFTYCELPRGFDASPESKEKFASWFLQLCAKAILLHKGVMQRDAFDEFLAAYRTYDEKFKLDAAFPLPNAVDSLQTYMNSAEATHDVISFAKTVNLSKLAATAASRLQIANEKIAMNVEKRLLSLYSIEHVK